MGCTKLKKEIIYKARVGAPFKKEDAQYIGETIAKIENKFGQCTPEFLVEEAKNNKVLNELFIWDKSEGFRQYQLQTARNIINHIVETVIVCKEETEQKSFLSVTTDEGKTVYVSREVVIETPNYRKQMIDQIITILENATVTLKSFRQYEYPK